MAVMGQAELPTQGAGPGLLGYAAGGAVIAFVLGVFGHLAAARADRRLRAESEIAAALGSPVLATVDVPDEHADGDRAANQPTRKAQLTALVLGRQPWYEPPLPVAGDEFSRDIRYRRALARLHDAAARQPLLVIVPGDDAAAHQAAARLAASSVAGPRDETLTVLAVAPDRPAVPDGAGSVLVVLTTGTRTAWELVGIAEACADADRRVVGAIVAHRTQPEGGRTVAPRPPAEDVLTGSE